MLKGMNKQSKFIEIKTLISSGDINKALKNSIELADFIKNKELSDRVVLLQSRLRRLEKDFRDGLISKEEETKGINLVTISILQELNDLEDQESVEQRDESSISRKNTGTNISNIIESKLVLVKVESGSFSMGWRDKIRDGEKSHLFNFFKRLKNYEPLTVRNIKGFSISKYLVTNFDFCIFLNDFCSHKDDASAFIDLAGEHYHFHNFKCPIKYSDNKFVVSDYYNDHPVVFINWYGACNYCNWISQVINKIVRLPSEAEWEYAARGGKKSNGYIYAGSNYYDEVAVYQNFGVTETNRGGVILTGGETAKIATKLSNELGLFDMSGLVYEWCLDNYAPNYLNSPSTEAPIHIGNGKNKKVVRGGSWELYMNHEIRRLRNCSREYRSIHKGYGDVGFRVVVED